ncbi:50S ribosomal protein L23 [bacterium]|nr:50S ribosomal protein L23 [bacterium]
MRDATDIIIEPVISELSTTMAEEDKYVFVVHTSANKIEIKYAVEKLFNVGVKKVNVINVLGKRKRMRFKTGKRSDWKKAVITLNKGDKIEFI